MLEKKICVKVLPWHFIGLEETGGQSSPITFIVHYFSFPLSTHPHGFLPGWELEGKKEREELGCGAEAEPQSWACQFLLFWFFTPSCQPSPVPRGLSHPNPWNYPLSVTILQYLWHRFLLSCFVNQGRNNGLPTESHNRPTGRQGCNLKYILRSP